MLLSQVPGRPRPRLATRYAIRRTSGCLSHASRRTGQRRRAQDRDVGGPYDWHVPEQRFTLRVPPTIQDVLLAVLVTALQVQGTIGRTVA